MPSPDAPKKYPCPTCGEPKVSHPANQCAKCFLKSAVAPDDQAHHNH